jgi:hypothetical protein
VFEAVFAAACAAAVADESVPIAPFDATMVDTLKADPQFVDAASTKSSNKAKVAIRLQRARDIILAPRG